MRCARGFLAVFLAGSVGAQSAPPAAIQQSRLLRGLWAYRQHDFREAAAQLRAYAFDTDSRYADPWAMYRLAQMHERGLGVVQDLALACAYYDLARRTFNMQRSEPDRSELEEIATEAYDRICAGKNDRDAAYILALMSCYRDGPPTAEFVLDNQRSVVVDRLYVTVQSDNAETQFPLPLGNGCNAVVLPVALTQLRNRDFLHYYFWISSGTQAAIHSTHSLHWAVLEITARGLELRVDEELYRTDDLTYPGVELPPESRDIAKLEMDPAGEIEWTIAANPRRSGIIRP